MATAIVGFDQESAGGPRAGSRAIRRGGVSRLSGADQLAGAHRCSTAKTKVAGGANAAPKVQQSASQALR